MAPDPSNGTDPAAGPAFDLSQLNLAHVPDKRRFEARLGEKVVSIAAYADSEDPGRADAAGIRDFYHTLTQPAYGGNGIAARLIQWALDESIAEGYRIQTGCSFVKYFVDTHPEYAEHRA